MILIKKYGNRRLYDTDASRYITLEELADRVRGGTDVSIVDAQSGEDLTQPTLAQIIMESRGGARMLPARLLHELIRLGDDGLTDFFGRYVTLALELYRQARQNAQALATINPLATVPFAATSGLARLLAGLGGGGSAGGGVGGLGGGLGGLASLANLNNYGLGDLLAGLTGSAPAAPVSTAPPVVVPSSPPGQVPPSYANLPPYGATPQSEEVAFLRRELEAIKGKLKPARRKATRKRTPKG
jgi:polyhydroxyalkanoate synthesis repressor PhaR